MPANNDSNQPRSRRDQTGSGALAYEHSLAGIIIVNPVGEIVESNSRACQLFGYDHSDFIKLRLSDLVPQTLRGPHAQWVRTYFEQPHSTGLENGAQVGALRSDGSEFKLSIGLKPTPVGDETWVTATFIPVHQESEDHPLQGLERWRHLLEGLGGHLWFWEIESDAVDLSPDWKLHFGYDANEITTGSSWFELVHPSDLASIVAASNACLKGDVVQLDHEFRVRRKTGGYRWLRSRARVIDRDRHGQPRMMVGLYNDITVAREAELARQDAEQRWQFALEGSGAGVWDWNLATNEVYFSPQWKMMLGFEADDLEPNIETWRQLALPADLARSDAAIADYMAGKTDSYQCECRVRMRDGSIKWVLDRGKIVAFDSNGKPTRMIGLHDDITETKMRELELHKQAAALRVANDDLEQFNYVASHDLKEPLRGIRHLTEWIEEDLGSEIPAAVNKNIARLRDRVSRLQMLIDDLAAYSRAGRKDAAVTTVSIPELAKEIVRDIDTRGCTIDISKLPDNTILTSKIALRTVLKNLMVNAIVHHDVVNFGHVHVSGEIKDNIITFSVEDDGPGIAPEHHERIFRIYQRLDPERYTDGSGSGLAIVRRVINRLSSRISLISPITERGTRFEFDWPRHWPREEE